MSVWLSHPTGNPNVRAVLRALEREALDPVFWTTIAFPPLVMARGVCPRHLRAELCRRYFPEISQQRIRTFPVREILRQGALRFGLERLVRHERGVACTDAVYRSLDRRVARRLLRSDRPPAVVYAYDDGALETFLAAERSASARVFELPTVYWRETRRLFAEEQERRPGWRQTLRALRDSPEKLRRKDRELALADLVIVPSRFAARTLCLAPHSPRRVAVIPYGCTPVSDELPTRRRREEPLRLLYAGIVGQQKGVADLFEALDRIRIPYELTIAGPAPFRDCVALQSALSVPGRKWIGRVPHGELMCLMRQHHVLVFPSLVEGFGLVLAEAMANGLPFLATPHTGAPELLSSDGVEGFIVPIRDPDAIAERLTNLYENEDMRFAMAEAARRRAAEMSWRRFEDRVATLVGEFVR